MMQEIIVALIVLCAAVAVLKRYAPKALKQWARSWGARTARRIGWLALAERIERQAQAGASCADGCGTCGNCGSAGQAAPVEKQTVISVESLKQTIRR
jgi:hypothetical protein